MIGNHASVGDGSQAGETLTGVDRVLACLILLAGESGGAGLDEIAKGLGSPKSSTHRALACLVRAGLAEQDGDRRYRLSLNFVRLAFSYYEGLDRSRLIQPVLDELAEMFEETVHHGELDGAQIVYLAQARPRGERVQMTARIGGRNPAYCTGLGKALLAYSLTDSGAVSDFVKLYGPLTKRTPKTMTSVSALNEEFRATRERGYALDREESDPGITCIAFPLFVGASRPAGAISISALASRTPLEALIDRADEIRTVVEAHLGAGAVPAPAFT